MKHRFSLSLTIALVLALAVTSLALADVITPDADIITAGDQPSQNLGTVAPGATLTTKVSFKLECAGNKHVDDSQKVNLTFTLAGSTVPAGGSLSATNTTIGALSGADPGIPASWPDDGTKCPDPLPGPIGDNGDSTVTITAPMTSGPHTFVVKYDPSLSPAGGDDPSSISGSAPTATFTLTVGKATATVNLSNLTQNYTGSPLTPTATTIPAGLTIDWTNAPQTNAGSYSVTATVNDPNYEGSASGTFVINKANATCTVNGYTGVYDGNVHGASGSCTGVGGATLSGLDLGSSFTNVPGGNANWTFSNANYVSQSGAVAITIAKANAACTINGYTGVYDGDAHSATGSCIGVLAEPLDGLDLGAKFTNVPGGTADWVFTDVTGNYNDDSDSVAIDISKADATCSISGYSDVYDGAAHGATGSCIGVLAEPLAGLDLGAKFTNVPGGTADWVFTDVTGNYNDDSDSVAIDISKADATCAVTGYSVPYDGNEHIATGSCTGVKGESLSGLDLSGTKHTNAGSYTDAWTFTDVTGNYKNASGTVSDSIAKVDPTCSITGYSVIFDNAAHTATGSCKGVKNESLSGLDLSGTMHTFPGDYNDTWTFTDVTGNYNDASGTVHDIIIAWTLKGFYQPVDMNGVYNIVKNGSTVPMKFEIFTKLGGVEITDVGAVKSLIAAVSSCSASATFDEIETVATGGTVLRYDITGGQFIYNWKTPNTAQKCYRVTMTTIDGSSLVAYFKLK